MYLKRLRLWNFRKFGSDLPLDAANPNITVNFVKGINLLVGQNDSGKSAIVDAIKLVTYTHSGEWIKLEHEDFYSNQNKLIIELLFDELSDEEGKNFIEWLSWIGEGEALRPHLCLFLEAERVGDRILPFDIKAGTDRDGRTLSAEAKAYLKVTYLRPLRDAKSELTPKRNSRLSQILLSHEAFEPGLREHEFVSSVKGLNKGIKNYFEGLNPDDTQHLDQRGLQLKSRIDHYLEKFANKKSKFSMNDSSLRAILESLCLLFHDGINLGLGSHNILVIASELLHLQKTDWTGIRLGLFEEIEAHLHPQTQLQVMETLDKEAEEAGIQLIFTTHSPNIASKVRLRSLIVCQDSNAFSLGEGNTKLRNTDYFFLERFLDVTKANLFFASGIILVEGWAEEQIIPALARKIGIDLTKAGVSVVTVGSTAFLRYSKILLRNHEPYLNTRVSVINDVDVKPFEASPTRKERLPEGGFRVIQLTAEEIERKRIEEVQTKTEKFTEQNIRGFISPYWTLEYCIARSTKLRKLFYKAVLMALREEKEDDGVADLDGYTGAIDRIDEHFNNWEESELDIAYAIMNHILTGENNIEVAEKKISKAVIAQNFAKCLNEDNLIQELDTEGSIKYLLDAIRYAANIG